jgi:hypothetical protein
MALAPITAAQLQRRVDAAIARGSPSVDVPGGAYLFNTSGGTDFLILGASQLRIRALAPVTLWFAGGAGVNLTDSADVQLVGSEGKPAWILDYDPPATKQVLTGSTLNLLNCTRVLAEDVTIRAAPYMAVTAWNGGGAHVFRRLIFEKMAGRAKVGLRDATHFSDQRVGPTIEDSVIGFTGDDFFNVHSTLMLVLECETKSCLVINPHLFDIARNTAYGTNSVMETVIPGTDMMSFYAWPNSDMRTAKQGGPLRVASATEITDPQLLVKAATLVPELEGGHTHPDGDGALAASSGGWTSFTNKTVSWNAKELWRVGFHGAVPAGVGRGGIITIDTISNAGAKLLNTRFVNTTCNLGRIKSSNAVIQGCTFENARIPNMEITYLPQFFEGPVEIFNITLADNIISGDGPAPIHCGPLCEMAGCQDERGGDGRWVKHSCAACQSCEADTYWTRGIVLRNNTITP